VTLPWLGDGAEGEASEKGVTLLEQHALLHKSHALFVQFLLHGVLDNCYWWGFHYFPSISNKRLNYESYAALTKYRTFTKATS
jgi:hypothetical protein